MDAGNKPFEVNYSELKLVVLRHTVSGQVIYRIQFSDKRPPLVITRALHANANRFWTSIPEGRQKEAEEIGPLIADFINKNQ